MGSTASIIIGMLSLAAAALGFAWTRSYWVSILIAVTAMLVGKSVLPFLQILWDKFQRRYFPLPEIQELCLCNMKDDDSADVPSCAQGIRVLAMTEDLKLNSKTKEVYLEMIRQTLEALSKEHPIFARRLEVVQRREMPAQYVCSLCGKDGQQMRKCLKAWFKTYTLRDMKSRTQNRDLFLYDGEIQVKNREESVRYTVLVLFDGSLPVTIPKESEEASSEADGSNK